MAVSMVVGSRFKPFSYQEMLQPVMMADTEHKALDAELSDLNTKSSVWEKMANETTDPVAFNTYKNYSTALKNNADALAESGLNASSRRSMLDLRSRYASDIVPIEQAFTRRKELQDEQRKALLQNPALIYNRKAADFSLDELITNPSLAPQSVSGSVLTKQVSDAVSPFAKQIVDEVRAGGQKANEWKRILGGQYYEKVFRTGFEAKDIQDAIQGRGPKVLQDAVTNAINSSGVGSWNSPEALNQARYYANQGLYSAIGQTDYKTLNNKAWDEAARAARENAQLKKAAKEAGNAALPYTMIPKASRTNIPGIDTDQISKDKQIVNNLVANPNLLNMPAPGTSTSFNMAKSSEDAYVKNIMGRYKGLSESKARQMYNESNPWRGREQELNTQLLQSAVSSGAHTQETAAYYQKTVPELMTKYGAKNMQELQLSIARKEATSATINSDYMVQLADMSLAKEALGNKALFRSGSGSTGTGLRELDANGTESKSAVSQEDIMKIFSNKSAGGIGYDPQLNKMVIRVLPDGEGETKQYSIDPRLLDSSGELETYMNVLDKYRSRSKEREYTNQEIMEMGEIIHTMMMNNVVPPLNSIHKTQGKSGEEKGNYPNY